MAGPGKRRIFFERGSPFYLNHLNFFCDNFVHGRGIITLPPETPHLLVQTLHVKDRYDPSDSKQGKHVHKGTGRLEKGRLKSCRIKNLRAFPFLPTIPLPDPPPLRNGDS